jgi:hypothetical protein
LAIAAALLSPIKSKEIEMTSSHDGGAMPAPAHQTRRALLRLFGAAPALAILPAAASIPTTTLADLIEAHRGARAAFCEAIDALEAAEPDEETVIPGIDVPIPVKSHRYEDLKAYVEDDFAEELEKTATIAALSPALGEQARAVLKARKAFCLARLDEVFAGFAIAEAAYNAASAAEDDAVTAICAHRCATIGETTIKLRYLLRDSPIKDEIQPEHYDALFASFLPETEGSADV